MKANAVKSRLLDALDLMLAASGSTRRAQRIAGRLVRFAEDGDLAPKLVELNRAIVEADRAVRATVGPFIAARLSVK